MELTIEKVGEILTAASEHGASLKVRDISYVILRRYFEDRSYAWRVCFGADAEYDDKTIDAYEESNGYKFLVEVLSNVRDRGSLFYDEDITFEENKAYMLKLKKDTEMAMEAGDLEKKDGLKILSDLSVKLNDKFSVQAEVKDQMVVVEQKYDDICSYCQHEVARRPLSKEEAMEMYNLREK
jgi:hypothetical protein